MSEDEYALPVKMKGIKTTVEEITEVDYKKETVAMENEFLSLGISKLNSEFEDLVPLHEFDGMDVKVVMYELQCGLVITEGSYQNLKKLLD